MKIENNMISCLDTMKLAGKCLEKFGFRNAQPKFLSTITLTSKGEGKRFIRPLIPRGATFRIIPKQGKPIKCSLFEITKKINRDTDHLMVVFKKGSYCFLFIIRPDKDLTFDQVL